MHNPHLGIVRRDFIEEHQQGRRGAPDIDHGDRIASRPIGDDKPAIRRRVFDIDALDTLSDDDAITAISSLRGFGRWSAEIYLMFSLKRTDIFPANDLALQVALQNLKNLQERPTAKIARNMVEHWSPWRSAGSIFLWHLYKNISTK